MGLTTPELRAQQNEEFEESLRADREKVNTILLSERKYLALSLCIVRSVRLL